MKRILHSLYGRIFGAGDDGSIVCPNGVRVGDYGRQWLVPTPQRAVIMDDFEGAALLGTWGVNKGSDGVAANFATLAQVNGMIRATTGAGAGATMAVNGVQINGGLNFQAQGGELEFAARFKLSAITNIAVFVGLTNQVAALQDPINGAGGGDTFTANAADAVGIVFDTTMTTKNWWLTGVAASVQPTQQNAGVAPVAATYEDWQISLDANGKATFFRNGLQVGVAMTGAVTKTVSLTPVIAAFTRSAASATVDADYLYTSALRI